MSKHYQPYEPSDASAPAANSEMPPYPGRLSAPPPANALPADTGGSTDKLKWIAVAVIAIVLLAGISMVFFVTWVSRQAQRGDTASTTSAQQVRDQDGYNSSLFDDVHTEGQHVDGGKDDPLRAFDLDDTLVSADDSQRQSRGNASTPRREDVVAQNNAGSNAMLGGDTIRSDVRFNADARPAPRALGPVPGARTTPSEVPIIRERPEDADDKVALNIYQPGQGIPLTRRETAPPIPERQPQQNPNEIRNSQGVLALPQGYNGQPVMQPQQQQQQPYNNNGGYTPQPQPQMNNGGYAPQPQQQVGNGGYAAQPQQQMGNGGYAAQPQPQMNNGGYAAQPAPFNQQAWNGQPQQQYQPQVVQQQQPQQSQWPATAPAQQYQQQQPMPQYQTPPMQQQQPQQQYNPNGYRGQPNPAMQQQLPPAAQLDPYANAAGSPTNAQQAPPQEQPTGMGPPSASSHFGRGLAAQQSGDKERAIEYYKRALDANPGHFGAYNNLGVVYRQQGDYDKAIEVLSEALVLHPNDARVANNLAGCYMKRHQYPEAERVLRQAISAAPNDLAAMTNLGIVYTAMGNFRDADYHLTNAVKVHPQEARAYYNLGNLYRRMGRSELAMRQYLQFLELSRGKYPQQEAQVRQMLGNTGNWGR